MKRLDIVDALEVAGSPVGMDLGHEVHVSCDIAYSANPTALRASSRSRNACEDASLPSRSVTATAHGKSTGAPLCRPTATRRMNTKTPFSPASRMRSVSCRHDRHEAPDSAIDARYPGTP